MELLAVPKRVHLQSRSHLEPYAERSRVNGWNGSKWELLGNDAAIHCLHMEINKRRLKRWNLENFRLFLRNKRDADVFVLKNIYDSRKPLELFRTDPV